LKEARVIPDLIYNVEQWEAMLIKCSKMAGVHGKAGDLTQWSRRSTSRDFRIDVNALIKKQAKLKPVGADDTLGATGKRKRKKEPAVHTSSQCKGDSQSAESGEEEGSVSRDWLSAGTGDEDDDKSEGSDSSEKSSRKKQK
jgi:hypothetical protein